MDDTLADPIAGRLIDGRYAVSARIAHGGMATVYLATDTRLDRQVALKVMHAELARDGDFVRRFIDEAKSVARLSHQNVVAVYDQGADGPFLYLAMEYVPGRTLRDLLREWGCFPPELALEIMSGVLDGLAAAHASGIVHRDVKPENVLITTDGRVKVADFGLARAQAEVGHTRAGTIIGTVAYLAPEQVTGTFPTGPRSDVYAAGVLLYELLTGTKPFTGETPISIAYQHVNSDVPAPSTRRQEIPAVVDRLVLAATDRDAARRPADAAQFLRAVRQVAAELPPAPGPGLAGPGLAAATEHSGLTGMLGVGVQGTGEAPWLDFDSSVATPARTGGRHASGAWSGVRTDPWSADDTGAFSNGAGPGTGGFGNHTLVVRRDEAGRYPGGREPFLGRWLFSRRLIVVVLSLVVLVAIGVGGWWFTSGRFTTVPSVANLTLGQATDVLTGHGFAVAAGHGAEHSNTVPAGQVAGTSPSGRVASGARIEILLSDGPFTSVIPAVKGSTEAAAETALRGRHLTLINVKMVGSTAAKGTVAGVSPKAGTTWPQTKPVTLQVVGGLPLPKFSGMTESAAGQLARQDGITLEATNVTSSDQPQGTIITQSPAPNSVLQKNEVVDVTVSNGPQLVDVPYVFGESVQQAKQTLQAAGFKVTVSGPDFFGQVWDTDPSPYTPAPHGSTVVLETNFNLGGGNGNGGGGNGGGNGGGGPGGF